MGFRFRKSVNLGGFRVNFSKSGIGYSVGTKGARFTKTAKGRTRTSLGIPGTGLGYVKESGSASNHIIAKIVLFPIFLMYLILKFLWICVKYTCKACYIGFRAGFRLLKKITEEKLLPLVRKKKGDKQ